MQNKKGFTLIELLVTIVIMISVLGIAIVSVNKISESRKKAAYDSVKEQIITAAKEYFNNNEYFIKDLVLTDSETGFVSLGTLVNLDYINSVINPTNNEKLDMCSFVKVTADNKYEFVDDPTEINAIREEYIDCVMGEPSEIELTERVEPIVVNTTSFNINVYKKNKGNCSNDGNPILNLGYNKDEGVINQSTKWFNNSDTPNGLFLEIIDDNLDDNLEYVFKDSGESNKCIDTDAIHELEIVATDLDLDDEQYKLTVKLDREPPTINASVATSSWTNAAKVNVNIILTDNVSKVKYENRYWNEYGLTKAEADSSNYTWTTNKYNNGKNKETNNINKNSYTHIENYSGEGYRKGKIKACDYAGNCAFGSEYVVKIDRTLPTMKVTRQKCDYNSSTQKYSNCSSYSNDTWINKWVKTSMTAEDTMSGVDYSCYTTTGATTNQKCADTMKYDDTISRAIFAEGKSYIRYATCDNAGNCLNKSTGTTRYTIKLDRTSPKITSFTNTQNKKCKTSAGNVCYYSHTVTAADYNPNNIDVSGLKSQYKYNHCYDNATSSQSNIICPSGFKSNGNKSQTYIYPDKVGDKVFGYANRKFTNGSHIQEYTHKNLTGYYNLFYKIYDNAGNSTCYRYKLNYTDDNKYTTATPVWVSGDYHCDDN